MRRQIARRRDQSLSPRRRGDQLHPTAQVPGLVRTQRRLGQEAALVDEFFGSEIARVELLSFVDSQVKPASHWSEAESTKDSTVPLGRRSARPRGSALSRFDLLEK